MWRSVSLCVCVCVCPPTRRAATARGISFGGEGNALHSLLSSLSCDSFHFTCSVSLRSSPVLRQTFIPESRLEAYIRLPQISTSPAGTIRTALRDCCNACRIVRSSSSSAFFSFFRSPTFCRHLPASSRSGSAAANSLLATRLHRNIPCKHNY